MSKFANQPFKQKFLNALRGFKILYTKQASTKRQMMISAFFLVMAALLKFSLIEFCILGIMITLIFLSEFVNSAIEYMQDELFGDNYSEIARDSKDMAAGIVFWVILMTNVIGSCLFFPKIFALVVR